jgi:hypothetical protein
MVLPPPMTFLEAPRLGRGRFVAQISVLGVALSGIAAWIVL